MTSNSLNKLLATASPAISGDTPRLPAALSARAGILAPQLLSLYWNRNGFYAFESALHVRPLGTGEASGVVQWNDPQTWLSMYRMPIPEAVFFAEDVFGCQYAAANDSVHRFDPETGRMEEYAASLLDWARRILDETAVATGWPLAHSWQLKFGPLKNGYRLVPAVPFVLGGEFAVSNLQALPEATAMSFYADIANQMWGLPDGSRIKLRVVE